MVVTVREPQITPGRPRVSSGQTSTLSRSPSSGAPRPVFKSAIPRLALSSTVSTARARAPLGERSDNITPLIRPAAPRRSTQAKTRFTPKPANDPVTKSPPSRARPSVSIVKSTSQTAVTSQSSVETPNAALRRFMAGPPHPRFSMPCLDVNDNDTLLLDMRAPDMSDEGMDREASDGEATPGLCHGRAVRGGMNMTPAPSQEVVLQPTSRPLASSSARSDPITRLPTPPSSQANDVSSPPRPPSGKVHSRPSSTPRRRAHTSSFASVTPALEPSPNPRRKKSPRISEVDTLNGPLASSDPSRDRVGDIVFRIVNSATPPPRTPTAALSQASSSTNFVREASSSSSRASASQSFSKTPAAARRPRSSQSAQPSRKRSPPKTVQAKSRSREVPPKERRKSTGTRRASLAPNISAPRRSMTPSALLILAGRQLGVTKEVVKASPGDDPLLLVGWEADSSIRHIQSSRKGKEKATAEIEADGEHDAMDRGELPLERRPKPIEPVPTTTEGARPPVSPSASLDSIASPDSAHQDHASLDCLDSRQADEPFEQDYSHDQGFGSDEDDDFGGGANDTFYHIVSRQADDRDSRPLSAASGSMDMAQRCRGPNGTPQKEVTAKAMSLTRKLAIECHDRPLPVAAEMERSPGGIDGDEDGDATQEAINADWDVSFEQSAVLAAAGPIDLQEPRALTPVSPERVIVDCETSPSLTRAKEKMEDFAFKSSDDAILGVPLDQTLSQDVEDEHIPAASPFSGAIFEQSIVELAALQQAQNPSQGSAPEGDVADYTKQRAERYHDAESTLDTVGDMTLEAENADWDSSFEQLQAVNLAVIPLSAQPPEARTDHPDKSVRDGDKRVEREDDHDDVALQTIGDVPVEAEKADWDSSFEQTPAVLEPQADLADRHGEAGLALPDSPRSNGFIELEAISITGPLIVTLGEASSADVFARSPEDRVRNAHLALSVPDQIEVPQSIDSELDDTFPPIVRRTFRWDGRPPIEQDPESFDQGANEGDDITEEADVTVDAQSEDWAVSEESERCSSAEDDNDADDRAAVRDGAAETGEGEEEAVNDARSSFDDAEQDFEEDVLDAELRAEEARGGVLDAAEYSGRETASEEGEHVLETGDGGAAAVGGATSSAEHPREGGAHEDALRSAADDALSNSDANEETRPACLGETRSNAEAAEPLEAAPSECTASSASSAGIASNISHANVKDQAPSVSKAGESDNSPAAPVKIVVKLVPKIIKIEREADDQETSALGLTLASEGSRRAAAIDEGSGIHQRNHLDLHLPQEGDGSEGHDPEAAGTPIYPLPATPIYPSQFDLPDMANIGRTTPTISSPSTLTSPSPRSEDNANPPSASSSAPVVANALSTESVGMQRSLRRSGVHQPSKLSRQITATLPAADQRSPMDNEYTSSGGEGALVSAPDRRSDDSTGAGESSQLVQVRNARQSLHEELAYAEDGDVSVNSVVEVSSLDPRAAARAAAILKLNHAYIEHGSHAGGSMPRKTARRRSFHESTHFSPADTARRLPKDQLLHEAELEIVSAGRGRSRSMSVFSAITIGTTAMEPCLPGGWVKTPKRKRVHRTPDEPTDMQAVSPKLDKGQRRQGANDKPWGVQNWKRLEEVYRAEREAWIKEREVKPMPSGLFGWAKRLSGISIAAPVVEWDEEKVVDRFVREEGAERLGGEWARDVIRLRVKALERRVAEKMAKESDIPLDEPATKKLRLNDTPFTPASDILRDRSDYEPPSTVGRFLGRFWSDGARESEEAVLPACVGAADRTQGSLSAQLRRTDQREPETADSADRISEGTPQMRQVDILPVSLPSATRSTTAPASQVPAALGPSAPIVSNLALSKPQSANKHPARSSSSTWSPAPGPSPRAAAGPTGPGPRVDLLTSIVAGGPPRHVDLALSTSSTITNLTSFETPAARLFPPLYPPISQRSSAIKTLFPDIHPLGSSTSCTASNSSPAGGSRPIAIPTGIGRGPKASVRDLVRSFEDGKVLDRVMAKRAQGGGETGLRRIQSSNGLRGE